MFCHHWFDSLSLRCDRQHSHAPWTPTVINGKVHYPTHSEEILCERMASILLAVVAAQGVVISSDLHQHAQMHNKTLNRLVLGALPRGKHVKPLVSEYGTYINVIINAQADEHLQSFVQTLPKGANIQSRGAVCGTL